MALKTASLVIALVSLVSVAGSFAQELPHASRSKILDAAAAVVVEAPAPHRTWGLRLSDEDGLLVSTWPGEHGRLQTKPNAADVLPVTLSKKDRFPESLTAIVPMLEGAPPGVRLLISGVHVPPASFSDVTLPREFTLPRHGWVDPVVAEEVLGKARRPGAYAFSTTGVGALHMRIESWDETGLRYEFLVRDNETFDVARARGIELHASVSGDVVNFRLEAPTGAFESLGCQPVPGSSIPPGYYEIIRTDATTWTLRRYADRIVHDLQSLTITV
ncbi:MAG: hypothetical protein WDA16_12080, partial [Candidatus Thermoplasmatota archaeon]